MTPEEWAAKAFPDPPPDRSYSVNTERIRAIIAETVRLAIVEDRSREHACQHGTTCVASDA